MRICFNIVEPSCPNDTAELRGSVFLQQYEDIFHRIHLKKKNILQLYRCFGSRKKNGGWWKAGSVFSYEESLHDDYYGVFST